VPFELTCPRCTQAISPHDIVEPYGYRVAHFECSLPLSLSPEESVFIYVYCWDHCVAECAACAQSFRQDELVFVSFNTGRYLCLHCHQDLTESVRGHLLACATIPEQLRQKVREAGELTQKLLKQSRLLGDRADVLRREMEAARAELSATMRERARRERTGK